MVTRLSEGFSFDSIWQNFKTAGQSAIDKTATDAKTAAGKQIDRVLGTGSPGTGTRTSTTTPPIIAPPADDSGEEKSSGMGKTLLYVGGAAIVAFIIYKATR